MYVVGSGDAESLRHFFGFSERELSILLNDLRGEGLADFSGDEVSLSEKGRDIFRESEDGALRIQSVERWNEKFAIDFVSFSIIHFESRSEEYRCFHELASSDLEKVSRSKEVAKEVFADSFHEYVERYKGDVGNEDRARLSIYGISSVESRDTFAFPLSVDFYVSSENPKQVDQRYLVFNTHAAQEKRRRIAQEVAKTINDLKIKSRFGNDVQWLTHEQLAGPLFSEFFRDGRLDVGRAIEAAQQRRDSGAAGGPTIPIVGAFYVEENASVVWEFIRQTAGHIKTDEEKREANLPSTIFWQKPSNEMWGRDDGTYAMISRVRREATSVVVGNSELNLVFNSKFELAKKLKWRLTRKNNRNVFDNGFSTAFRDEMCPVEAFLWPGVVGGVLYYYLEDDSAEYPVPLGFITRDPEVLGSLSRFLFAQWAGFGRKVYRVWPLKDGSDSEIEVTGRDAFAALVGGGSKGRWGGKTLTLPKRDS